MIKVEGVSFKYKNSDYKILDNLNFSVNDGEIIALVGENGSRKIYYCKINFRCYKIKGR